MEVVNNEFQILTKKVKFSFSSKGYVYIYSNQLIIHYETT